VAEKVEKILLAQPEVDNVVSLPGTDIIGGGNKTSVLTFFVILKHWDERTGRGHDVDSVIGRFFGLTSRIREAVVLAFNPPPIRGLGRTGGFEVYLQNRGEGDTSALAEQTDKLIGALNRDPRLIGVRTLFRAHEPQLHVELDREKAKAAGVDVDEVFSTLQATFSQLYVNDFNKSGRTFRVQLQAEAEFRSRPDDLKRVYVRSGSGSMIPLASLLELSYDTGAEVLERYNGFPAVKILGAGAPDVSSGDAIRAVEQISESVLPEDYTISWTGSAFQEKRTGGSSRQVFLFGVVFVFLILAAQYERWSLPLAVILAVPFGVLGALTAIWLRGLANDVYFQIGLVTLVGLAAKNAILIVEFASQRHEAGRSVREAALEAARLRFRPIVMTSLAFILGVLPLAVSTGAGAAGRHSIGTGVLGGMLAATFLAVFFVPLFFELLSRWTFRDRETALAARTATAEEA
jgi:hydrophobe/amphiphile efflux-1 (HAE1) family protein